MGELKIGDTFTCEGVKLIIYDNAEEITNPFSGESCMLCAEAIAIYDYIKGCEILNRRGGNYDFTKQLHYFQNKWPEEYYILLD